MNKSREWIHALHPGDEVYWNDPDNEECSRRLIIQSIEFANEVVKITCVDGNYLECLASELS
jgi:hypothetical protein